MMRMILTEKANSILFDKFVDQNTGKVLDIITINYQLITYFLNLTINNMNSFVNHDRTNSTHKSLLSDRRHSIKDQVLYTNTIS
jgi:hypothetical protein